MKSILAFVFLFAFNPFSWAVETWMTGVPFADGGLLMFQVEAPVEGNPSGDIIKLGTTKNSAELLPVLQRLAEKQMVVRLYGDISRDKSLPPGYSGTWRPNVLFAVWKIHAHDEPDTWDPGRAPKNLVSEDVLTRDDTGQVVASQPSSEGFGPPGRRAVEVPKKSELRRAITLGIRDKVYGSRALSVSNPRNVKITTEHFFCDGTTAAVKAIKVTADGSYHDPSPILMLLRQNDAGDWYIFKEVTAMSRAEKEAFAKRGFPISLFP